MILFQVVRQVHRFRSTRRFSEAAIASTTPVVIVGGGPTGLLLSNLLSSYGTPSVLLEAQTTEQRFRHPQAHFLNTRTMEILRHSLPNVHAQVLEQMPPVHQWNHFQWGSSMTQAVARVRHPVDCPLKANADGNGKLQSLASDSKLEEESHSNDTGTGPPLSICSVAHLAQHHFCRLLWEAATRHSEDSSTLVEYGKRVTQVLEDHRDPEFPLLVTTDQGHRFRTKFVVAADGFHSSLRKAWKIGLQGKGDIQSLVNVHIKTCPELSAELHSDKNSAMLHFIYHPSVVAVVVCHSVGEYVLQIPFFPPFQTLERDFSPEKVRHMVQAALGIPNTTRTTDKHLTIVSVRPWTMSSLIAERYVAGDRCVLAGDSAHVFPPAGGFGMNTGLQDVHNLAWRLSWLNHHRDNEEHAQSVMRRYEQERRPVSQQNAALSVRNYQRTLQLAKACYLNDQHPSAFVAMLSSPPFNFLPLEGRQQLFQRLVQTAMWPLGSLQDETSIHGQRMKHNVRDILERGEGLPLLFPKYEVGFGYYQNDDTHNAEEDTWANDTAGFSPKLHIGHLLPHAVLRVASPPLSILVDLYPHLMPVNEESNHDDSFHISTTDLPTQLRQGPTSFYDSENHPVLLPGFVLLAIDCPSATLKYVLEKKTVADLGIPIHVVQVLSGEQSKMGHAGDSTVVLRDPHSTLRSMLPHVGDDPTFVLVRPDSHIGSILVVETQARETSRRIKDSGAVACPLSRIHRYLADGVKQALGTLY